MDIMRSLAIAMVLLFLITFGSIALPDKADLGQFVATFDMGIPAGSYQIEINPPTQTQNYNSYWFRVKSINSELGKDFIDVYIDDYGRVIDVSSIKLNEKLLDDLDLWKYAAKIEQIPLASVGGHPAVAGKAVNTTSGETAVYEAVYSPDGAGNSGTVLSTITSFYPEKETNAFLEHLQIRRQ